MKIYFLKTFLMLPFLLGLAVLLNTGTLFAYTSSGEYQGTPQKKFHRGTVNAATGWMELHQEINRTTETRGLFEGLTAGVARGVGLAIARTGAGIYEAVTFLIPMPEDYESVIQPETINNQ